MILANCTQSYLIGEHLCRLSGWSCPHGNQDRPLPLLPNRLQLTHNPTDTHANVKFEASASLLYTEHQSMGW